MKNKSTTNILGVRIDVVTIEGLNKLIIDRAKSKYGRPFIIFKPYVEFLSLASINDDVRKMLNQSDINAPDSIALQWAASYLYGKPRIHPGRFHLYYSLLLRIQNKPWLTQILPERMAGIDQTIPLLESANRMKLKIGIIGGPKDSDLTKKRLHKMFKGIRLQTWSGYYDLGEEGKIVNEIASSNLDILFCAMGFPKQEKFILANKNMLNAKVIIGEGGSFDYAQLGGPIKRAPKLLRKVGLEWLWRLLIQPSRFRRQMAIPNFIAKVYRQKKNKN